MIIGDRPQDTAREQEPFAGRRRERTGFYDAGISRVRTARPFRRSRRPKAGTSVSKFPCASLSMMEKSRPLCRIF